MRDSESIKQVELRDASGNGQTVRVEMRIENDVPALVLLGEDGEPKAAVYADLLEGHFQFLAYGRDQLEGHDGHVNVRFDRTGRFISTEANDFPDSYEE